MRKLFCVLIFLFLMPSFAQAQTNRFGSIVITDTGTTPGLCVGRAVGASACTGQINAGVVILGTDPGGSQQLRIGGIASLSSTTSQLLLLTQTGSSSAQATLRRTGGTAANWSLNIPASVQDLQIYSGDLSDYVVTFSANGRSVFKSSIAIDGAAAQSHGIAIPSGTPGTTTAVLYSPDGSTLWYNGTQLASTSIACGSLPALTGDVTTSAGSCATAIGTSKVTNTMLAGSIAYSKLSLTGAVLNADLAGSIASSKFVGTDIATVGTLTAGATGAGFTVALSTATVTGSLADARLSANVPLINAANVFTANQTISKSTPTITLTNTGGPTSAPISFDGTNLILDPPLGGGIMLPPHVGSVSTVGIANVGSSPGSTLLGVVNTSGTLASISVAVSTASGSSTAASFIPSASTVPTNGLYLPAANKIALATNSTRRLAISSAGEFGFGVDVATNIRIYATGTGTTDASYVMALGDSGENVLFQVRNGGTIVTGAQPTSPYNNTIGTGAANVQVGSDGTLYRFTSSLKFKTDFKPIDLATAQKAVLALGSGPLEIDLGTGKPTNGHAFTYRGIGRADDGNHRMIGWGAELVAPIDPMLATFDRSGKPDGVDYARMSIYLTITTADLISQNISLAKQLADALTRITALEKKAK